MRVFNLQQLHQDIGAAFRISSSENDKKFVGWLMTAFTKELLKNPPSGMFHPIEVKQPPSIIEGLNIQPYLVAKVPRFGDQKLFPQSEFDIKDAKAGTIRFYMPTESTIESYGSRVMYIRDFFHADVLLRENDDLRRLSFADSERASIAWHEQVAREARRRAEEWARRMETKSGDSVTEPVVGKDWCQVGDLLITGSGAPLIIHRLVSVNSLLYESMQMEHCVHTYAKRLHEEGLILCTVRHAGRVEKPVATFEIYADPSRSHVGIIQIKGKYNSNPDDAIPGVVKLLNDRIKTTDWFSVMKATRLSALSVDKDGNSGDLSVTIRTGGMRNN